MAFTKASSLVLLAFASLSNPIFAQNVFVNPPPFISSLDFSTNVDFPIDTSPLIQWTTDHRAYNVLLWQQNLTTGGNSSGGPSIFEKAPLDDEKGSFEWSVQPYYFDLNKSNVFYLALTPTENATAGFESHFFNITAPSPSSSPSSTAAPTVPQSSAPKTSNYITPSNPSPHDLVIGLGVTLPLVCVLGMAIGYFVAVRRMGSRTQIVQESQRGSEKALSTGSPHSCEYAIPEVAGEYPHSAIQEAPAVYPILEAPGTYPILEAPGVTERF